MSLFQVTAHSVAYLSVVSLVLGTAGLSMTSAFLNVLFDAQGFDNQWSFNCQIAGKEKKKKRRKEKSRQLTRINIRSCILNLQPDSSLDIS